MSAAAAMKQISHTFSQSRFPALNVRHFTFTRNFVMGCAICYAIENEYYSHLPLALFVPSPYAGYQVYKNVRPYIKRAQGKQDDNGEPVLSHKGITLFSFKPNVPELK